MPDEPETSETATTHLPGGGVQLDVGAALYEALLLQQLQEAGIGHEKAGRC